VHLRGDRRHIQDDDVEHLRPRVRGKLNLEMAATDEMLAIALALRPDQVTLVPERPEEVTTEGGLDLVASGDRVLRTAERLTGAGVLVSVFLDPDPLQIASLARMGADLIPGFEINTDRYTRAEGAPAAAELELIARAAELGEANGLHVYAGHGLTTANVGAVSVLSQVEELNIGHSIVARAVLVGMDAAVREMLAAMAAPAGRG
jgi:pyridoxine 5-phosphate synthase